MNIVRIPSIRRTHRLLAVPCTLALGLLAAPGHALAAAPTHAAASGGVVAGQAGGTTVPASPEAGAAGAIVPTNTSSSTPDGTGPTSTAGTPSAQTALTGRKVTRGSSTSTGKLSTEAILAAVLAGLIALACLVWAAFRWLALEPRWTLPLRHSIAEAGFRASAVWAEFTDWIRLGH